MALKLEAFVFAAGRNAEVDADILTLADTGQTSPGTTISFDQQHPAIREILGLTEPRPPDIRIHQRIHPHGAPVASALIHDNCRSKATKQDQKPMIYLAPWRFSFVRGNAELIALGSSSAEGSSQATTILFRPLRLAS